MSAVRSRLLALLGAAVLVACGPSYAPPPAAQESVAQPSADAIEAETARVNEWLFARWEEYLDFSPILKTELGRKDDYDKIDDVSEEGEKAYLEWYRQTVANLKEDFNYDLLTPDAKISYDLWVYGLALDEAALPFRRHGYIFTQMNGSHAWLPTFLINLHNVESADDMQAYIARIRGVSRAIDQLVERARINASEGVRPPRFAFEAVIEESNALLAGAPFDGEGDAPLWADAKAKIDALVESTAIDERRAEELRDAAESALR